LKTERITAHFVSDEIVVGEIFLPQTILAAETESSSQNQRFVTLGTFANQTGDLLVRALKDTATGEVSLHLISDKESQYRHVLVSLEGLEGEFPSDAHGKVILGKVELPDLRSATVHIKTPLTSFELGSLKRADDEILAKSEIILRNEQNESLRIEIVPSELDYTLKVELLNLAVVPKEQNLKVMITKGPKDVQVRNVEQGIAVFEKVRDGGGLVIHVFD